MPDGKPVNCTPGSARMNSHVFSLNKIFWKENFIKAVFLGHLRSQAIFRISFFFSTFANAGEANHMVGTSPPPPCQQQHNRFIDVEWSWQGVPSGPSTAPPGPLACRTPAPDLCPRESSPHLLVPRLPLNFWCFFFGTQVVAKGRPLAGCTPLPLSDDASTYSPNF